MPGFFFMKHLSVPFHCHFFLCSCQNVEQQPHMLTLNSYLIYCIYTSFTVFVICFNSVRIKYFVVNADYFLLE